MGVRERLAEAGLVKDVIERTEVIGVERLEATRAVSLTEALSDAPGANIANDCSLCGLKRLRLNGLRAEHTTVLIDGLPSHTITSGFYALDAIAMTGVERIEIARGAGASLTAPEAIGGVVNVITKEALEDGFSVEMSNGEWGFNQLGLLGTINANNDRTRVTLIAQRDQRDQFDADGNGISENPLLENASLSARWSQDVGRRDNFVFRLNHTTQESFGGPVIGDTTASIGAALASFDDIPTDAADLFENDDVRGRWLGKPWETTEWVDTTRNELAGSWLREINTDWNFELSTSFAKHEQVSFYEGFDYRADDEMLYANARFNYYLSDNHLLTFGVDNRTERLRSYSASGTANNLDNDPTTIYVSDAFDYDVSGAFLQDTWTVNDDFEIKAALRVDSVTADFTDPSKPGIEIDETVVSPRLDARYFHTDFWVSRFSAGRGYRAPLSFFETDHGLLDGGVGFEIDVDALERSQSYSYALSYEGSRLSSTLSATWTEVDDLAQLSETSAGVPLMTQLSESASVSALDWAVSYRFGDHLLASLVAERYDYDDAFKSAFGIAPIEEKLNLSLDWGLDYWDLLVSMNWVSGRDLNNYGYVGYNRLGDASSLKSTTAPSYYTVDFRLARVIGDAWTVYVGANNLFDYTQAGDQDTPLHWVSTDSADWFDVAYIHAPLRGRELYAGVKYAF
ncbi:MAG: TonB-dependent receptor [Gammaproteobacteria bacterium]|nr:TonB-dependent receptor [Gammaproteobacteria bacterium]